MDEEPPRGNATANSVIVVVVVVVIIIKVLFLHVYELRRSRGTRPISMASHHHSQAKCQLVQTRYIKGVRANCYCKSLLRMEIHMPHHASSVRAK